MATVLAGDIGGTYIRYQLYHCTPNEDILIKSETILSQNYKSNVFLSLQEFLQDQPVPEVAVLGFCGMIKNNKIVACVQYGTSFDPDAAAEALGIRKIYLLNDLESTGYALFNLSSDEYFILNPGIKDPTGPIVCGSIGTGLGQCYLIHDNKEYNVYSSEGGFQDYAPKSLLDKKFYNFICEKSNRPGSTYCSVVSGGNASIFYHFLRNEFSDEVNTEFDEKFMGNSNSQTKVMMEEGFGKTNALAAKAVDMWLNHLGYLIGNLFVNFLPTGGIFLIGGVISKNYEGIINHSGIIDGYFSGKAEIFHETMRQVPIYVVKPDNLGIRGALAYAKRKVLSSH